MNAWVDTIGKRPNHKSGVTNTNSKRLFHHRRCNFSIFLVEARTEHADRELRTVVRLRRCSCMHSFSSFFLIFSPEREKRDKESGVGKSSFLSYSSVSSMKMQFLADINRLERCGVLLELKTTAVIVIPVVFPGQRLSSDRRRRTCPRTTEPNVAHEE